MTTISDTEFADLSPVNSRRWEDFYNNNGFSATTLQQDDIYDQVPDMVMDEDYGMINNEVPVFNHGSFGINPHLLNVNVQPDLMAESSSFAIPEVESKDSNVFKSNSPYAPIQQFPLATPYDLMTVVPADAMLKSPEDSYYGSRFSSSTPFSSNMDTDLQFYIDPKETNAVAVGPQMMHNYLENPEDDYDDDEDDDDDNEYDDDDLYSPFSDNSATSSSSVTLDYATPSMTVATVPPANSQDAYEEQAAAAQHKNNGKPQLQHFGGGGKNSPANKKKLATSGPHRCEIVNGMTGRSCNKVFSRPYDLIRHQDTIHAAVRKTFKCDLCGENSKTFSRLDALSRHVRVKHT